jgi:Subtilase family
MSFRFSEFEGELSDDSDFITLSNHGGVYVSFVASSGDDFSSTAVGPQWPAVSPNVLAVGGTNLIPTTDGGYNEESWDDSQGGPSIHEAEPLYQYSVQRLGVREDPDVAYSAVDFAYYDSFSATSAGPPDWAHSSGTSYGAPQWAGLIAIANQGRTLAGETTLGVYIPSAIYAMPSSDFNDITTGPANREGYAPGAGLRRNYGTRLPQGQLARAGPCRLQPLDRHSAIPDSRSDVSTGSAPTPQVSQNAAVAASNLASPIDAGALDESAAVDVTPGAAVWNDPTVGNFNSAPLTPSDGKSSVGKSWLTIATQSASVNDRLSLPLLGAVARPAFGDGPSTDPSTASSNAEGIHWAGLNAAIDILRT